MLDLMHEQGLDDDLLQRYQIPPPTDVVEAGLPYETIAERRLEWLDARPAIKKKYCEAPGGADPLVLWGLPTSTAVNVGNLGTVYVVRTQRAAFQEWVDGAPWAAPGEVTIVLAPPDLGSPPDLVPQRSRPARHPRPTPPVAGEPTRPERRMRRGRRSGEPAPSPAASSHRSAPRSYQIDELRRCACNWVVMHFGTRRPGFGPATLSRHHMATNFMRTDHCGQAARPAMLLHLMRTGERAARVLLLGAWMALITFWSGQGNLPIDQPFVADVFHGFQHRLAHLAAFGLVGLLAWWACAGVPRAAFWAVLLTSLFGATDEWHQSFTLGRHSGIDDWAWDTACAAIAIFAWTRVRTTRWHAVPSPAGAAGNRGDVRAGGRPGDATECADTFGRQRRDATQRDEPGSPRCDRAGPFDPQRRPPAALDGSRLAPALAAGERICAARFRASAPGVGRR